MWFFEIDLTVCCHFFFPSLFFFFNDTASTEIYTLSLHDALPIYGISVGSHGRSHDSFLHLSRDALLAELTEAKRVVESVVGGPVTWLCDPHGEFSADAVEAAIRTGYVSAVTAIEGLHDPADEPYAVRRIG